MPIAIVTGSDSGIGKATAVTFARRGYDVGVTWHEDEHGARDTAREVRAEGVRCEVRRLDLEQLPEAADVIDELADALGGVDAFVNNAGMGVSAPFLELDFDDWRRVLAVDLDGAFLCAQRAARRMAEQGSGRIVNVTSIHEHVPIKDSCAYAAAKGGLGLLSKTMALELAEHGVTVNAVAPGEIATPMTDAHDVDPESIDREGSIPLGRPGHAHEIAPLIVWLCSDEASYVTGASFVADGGMTLTAALANRDR